MSHLREEGGRAWHTVSLAKGTVVPDRGIRGRLLYKVGSFIYKVGTAIKGPFYIKSERHPWTD